MFELLTAAAEIPVIGSLFEIGADEMTALAANAGSFIQSVWPLVLLAIGLPIAVWVLARLIGLVKKGIGRA